jgi:transposase
MRKIETFPWWSDLMNLKDDLSLRELAERFDVTPGAITAAFKRTGTTRKPAPPGPRNRRPARDEALPPEPGESGPSRPGSKDDLLQAHADLLGQVPDAEIARRAGVSMRTVAAYRARHGVKGYSGPRRRGADRKPRKSRIDEFADLVGTVPDREVAEQAGVSINTVRNWRVKRGVEPRGRSGGAAAPSAAPALRIAPPATSLVPAAPEAPPAGASAWKVVAGSTVRVVVAASIVEAASRAAAAGLGVVTSLEWIAEIA